jgi:hypothetical protein
MIVPVKYQYRPRWQISNNHNKYSENLFFYTGMEFVIHYFKKRIHAEIRRVKMHKKIRPEKRQLQNYYSAEFKLAHPKILYQFKLRRSESEPMFAVVKEGSKALDNINEGDIINMRYYPSDRSIPPETLDTRIKYITRDETTGFKNHYVIGLCIHGENEKIVA